MIGVDDERASPEVRFPVAHGEDKPNEFAFVRGEQGMAGGELSVEERHRTTPLMQHCSDAHARGITLHFEQLGEDWELEHKRRCERRLESAERDVSFKPPAKRVFAEHRRERHRDVIVAFNKSPVVADEPQERAHCLDGARRRPIQHRLHLSTIHGDTSLRDDMSQVGDLTLSELALGALDEELALQQLGEDQPNVKKMLRPAAAIDQDVVKKMSRNQWRKGRSTSFISA
jgi:hypothetical protein